MVCVDKDISAHVCTHTHAQGFLEVLFEMWKSGNKLSTQKQGIGHNKYVKAPNWYKTQAIETMSSGSIDSKDAFTILISKKNKS